MTISYNGMKPTTVELVCLGYHLTKCGNQTLCYSTSKYLHPFTHYMLYCMYYNAQWSMKEIFVSFIVPSGLFHIAIFGSKVQIFDWIETKTTYNGLF